MRRSVPFLLAFALLAGCDPDCADPGRIDGIWAVQGHPANDQAALTVTQGEVSDETGLAHDVFTNGASTWDIKYVPANARYTIIIGDDTYKGTYESDPDNCNAFALRFAGDYTTGDGVYHQFDWRGDLTWAGDSMGGTFVYEDDWTRTGGGSTAAGTISIPKGELLATRGGADTGS